MTPGMKMMMIDRARRSETENRYRYDRGMEDRYRYDRGMENRGGRKVEIEYEDTRDSMEPESRNRRRYRDGRFAPRQEDESLEMSRWPMYPTPRERYEMPENRYEMAEERRETPRSRYNGGGQENNFRRDGDGTRMLGFTGGYSMEMHGGGQAAHKMGHGGSMEQESRHLDQHTAKEWVEDIGECFSMEETMEALKKRKCKCEPLEFWVMVNAMKSDYPKLAAKYGVDHLDFYADMAVEWLEDRDAKPGKAMNYWKHIVKHG